MHNTCCKLPIRLINSSNCMEYLDTCTRNRNTTSMCEDQIMRNFKNVSGQNCLTKLESKILSTACSKLCWWFNRGGFMVRGSGGLPCSIYFKQQCLLPVNRQAHLFFNVQINTRSGKEIFQASSMTSLCSKM